MAGYRPKSLDELNNLYGKAISAENEIKKSSSLLKEEVLSDIIGGEKKAEDENEKPSFAPERRESGFSGDIDDFIRRFSGEQGASSLSETISKKPSPQPPQPPRPAFEGRTFAPAKQPDEKAESKKQENLSGLMNDYVRIMNGEDDEEDEDDAFSTRMPLFKSRRNDKKGKKKNSKDIIQDSAEPSGEEAPPVSEPKEAFSAPVAPSFEAPEYKAFEKPEAPAPSKPAPQKAEENPPQAKKPFKVNYPEDFDSPAPLKTPEKEETSAPAVEENANEAEDESFEKPFEPLEGENDEFVFGSAQAPHLSKGAVFAKVLLSVLLVFTLLATVLTGVGVFSVNSERALPGGYLTFCATNPYESAEIQSNDFIICKKQNYVNDGERVIYINRELRSFSFGVKNGEKTDKEGTVYYKIDPETVEKSNVLGVIVKVIPNLGKFVCIVIENYLFVLLGLVALAIILTLILCLAFRKRRYDDYYYDEDEFEDGEEHELPEPQPENDEQTHEAEDDEAFEEDSLYSGIE